MLRVIKSKYHEAYKYFYIHNLPQKSKKYLVTEYPRSGGTWLGKLIASYLDIPFQLELNQLRDDCIIHAHYLPFSRLNNLEKVYLMVRDGRDVLVSLYYHYLFSNNYRRRNPQKYRFHESNLNFENKDNIKENLPVFLEYIFTYNPSRLYHFTYSGHWGEFNKKWIDYLDMKKANNIYLIRYEELLSETFTVLKNIFEDTFDFELDENRLSKVVEENSFKAKTQRKPGAEDKSAFIRKGVAGDWKNHFSKESGEIFIYYAGDVLERLGYEKNDEWINKL